MKRNKTEKTEHKTGRKWILVVLGVYLAALAVLTILSNRILNETVPHVESCKVVSIYIDDTYYNKAVPNSAICFTEQYGYYVFEVVRKMTPLGERCYLNRTSVRILETDDDRGISAISTALGPEGEIVKTNDPDFGDKDIVVVERREE